MVFGKTMRAAKNVAKEGIMGGIGFVGAGIVGSAIETAAAPYVAVSATAQTNNIINAGVNFLSKVLLYGIVDKKLGSDAATGIATNAAIDVGLRVQNGGILPTSPQLFGYNILNGLPMQNPDKAGYGTLPTGPQTAERNRRYGSMPMDWAARQSHYGAMPYGSMPFEQNARVVNNQRRFGTAGVVSTPMATAEMFGMK